MKKINLLPTLSIVQQKEITRWHNGTMLLIMLAFIVLSALSMMGLLQLYALKRECAMLQKRILPHASSFAKQQAMQGEIELLNQRVVEFKKISQPTASFTQAACALLHGSTKIKSLTFNNKNLEFSFCCANIAKAEKKLLELRSLALFSELVPSSACYNKHGEAIIVVNSIINS